MICVDDAVRNEQIKLLVTLLNTIAGSSITVGILSPIAAAIYGVGGSISQIWTLATGVTLWGTCSVAFQSYARRLLEEIT